MQQFQHHKKIQGYFSKESEESVEFNRNNLLYILRNLLPQKSKLFRLFLEYVVTLATTSVLGLKPSFMTGW